MYTFGVGFIYTTLCSVRNIYLLRTIFLCPSRHNNRIYYIGDERTQRPCMGDEEVAEHEQQTVEPQRIIEMAHSIPIQPMQEFNPDAELGASLATRWNNWISDFEMFIVATGITDDTRK